MTVKKLSQAGYSLEGNRVIATTYLSLVLGHGDDSLSALALPLDTVASKLVEIGVPRDQAR